MEHFKIKDFETTFKLGIDNMITKSMHETFKSKNK